MKKFKVIMMVFTLIYLLVGWSNTIIINSSPQAVLRNNPKADFFIMDKTVYICAADIDWVKELALKDGEVLGKVNKTGVKKNFKDWNATRLEVNTEIHELEGREDIVLVKIQDKYIPYLQYVEG
jgi:hypothetical protein